MRKMTNRKNEDVSIEIAARRARLLAELVKVTFAELSPDEAYRAAALAAFDAALNEEPRP
jgi:hypothetical protein